MPEKLLSGAIMLIFFDDCKKPSSVAKMMMPECLVHLNQDVNAYLKCTKNPLQSRRKLKGCFASARQAGD